MNDEMTSGPAENTLAAEAAMWFAKLRGPDADRHRPAFDAWLARGALHLAAYNRAAEIFAMGKCLVDDDDEAPVLSSPRSPTQPRTGQLTTRAWFTIVAAAAALLFAIIWLAASDRLVSRRSASPTSLAQAQHSRFPLQLASRLGEVRTIILDDGSRLTLDSDSLLSVAFDPRQRLLRLERGRARFEVAHDTRPFIVAAGPGRVTATGTIFDVSVTALRGVSVRLLHGSVDVDMPSERAAMGEPARQVVSLRPGQMIGYADSPPVVQLADPRWPDALTGFDDMRLGDVIAQANARSAVKVRAADPAVAALRVSGSFRINDGRALAHRLAILFDLKADDTSPLETVLHQR